MHRLMMTLEYDGAGFCGWQLQAGGRTVQGVLERAIGKATGTASRVAGASRTDAGVHAVGQVAHVDTASELAPEQFLKAVNHWLPKDVSVLDCREAPEGFHARFSATSKLYRYGILRSAVRRPLREARAVRVWRALDVDAMAECAALLVGEHDFSSFASEHTEARSNVRRVTRCELIEDADELHLMIEANGFLYNMVRIIAGTLLAVGRSRMTPAAFRQAIDRRSRRAAGPTAAARGLTLLRVRYAEDPRSGTFLIG
ncbi:MAG: tRNA pseudouridine(38-40) synthase TruA [Candidatus Brocadiaceae bacterium]|nr:tRNA pseudouridine(38-40) synthase TruA [Candidatus Brocadiaceae bacterium]